MNLPKKISPCPIVESVFEIRFVSESPVEAIYGLLYKDLKADFPISENLAILQLPEPIRFQDPNLIHAPYYRFSNEIYNFSIGPKVIAFGTKANVEYVGWENLLRKITEILQKVKNLELNINVNRMALRYINFFSLNIFEKINLTINIEKTKLQSEDMVIRTALPDGKFIHRIQIANNATINFSNKTPPKKGSIIDIESYIQEPEIKTIDSINSFIGECHMKEKNLFFSLLEKDFLESLNPEY